MGESGDKPVIFISYSHRDEPEKPADGELAWLSYVQSFLAPAVKNGVFELWVDRSMEGGADWDPEIERKLRDCDIFVLLVSRHSLASDYIIDREIAIIREREGNGDAVHFYPIVLTPTPTAGRDKVTDKNLRPRDGKPLSGFPQNDRDQHMAGIADEIAAITERIAGSRKPAPALDRRSLPRFVDLGDLPETGYVTLVGRDAELQRLDKAWTDDSVNILSLIAEGGSGKSALVNEWLVRLQADNYRGAEAVLGWSFYSQGSKERATSAEACLDWCLERLDVNLAGTSATAKGEAIADALAARRALLILDGVEPLQFGPGPQVGVLKDPGLRALLRHLAAKPPAATHGLIVLTSRLAVADIGRWKDGVAPVVDLETLSDEAGAALLRDNSVWGTEAQLREASHAFGGHPLALALLASLLKETQGGDVRRRDHIRGVMADADNPGHAHAARVMESYDKEWLAGEPVLSAVMDIMGLFDRPADGESLRALRDAPVIAGLTEAIVGLSDQDWQRAVSRLRAAQLLAPVNPAAPTAIDAHPLVREWFGERLERRKPGAWRAAHGRIYDHLKDSTEEGPEPSLDQLAPLLQAVAHGCRAGRHQEALEDIYVDRIQRRSTNGEVEAYALKKLGAYGSDLAAIGWFFDKPYERPVAGLSRPAQAWVLGVAAFSLRAHGRMNEALPAMRAALDREVAAEAWLQAAIVASNLSGAELLVGAVAGAVADAAQSVEHADRSGDAFAMMAFRAAHADALHAAGRCDEAAALFADAEARQQKRQPDYPLLYSLAGNQYCDLLLGQGAWAAARDRAAKTLEWVIAQNWLLDIGLDTLTLGRAHLGLALENVATQPAANDDARTGAARLEEAVDRLRAAGTSHHIPRGLLARAALRRSTGDWAGTARDLDEVAEIAGPGPMKLFLCDLALERARLAFARIEAFAPLHGLLEAGAPKPATVGADDAERLKDEAATDLATARDLIDTYRYHRRDEELAELQAVLAGERRFADLPPRV